jgi:peptide-methionine (S)-S-oxide reductase
MTRPLSAHTLAAVLLTAALAAVPVADADERAAPLPAPAVDNPKAAGGVQTAVFAGGCFWGLQGVFEHVRGVRGVLAGYSGGSRLTARYGDVGQGHTGHAESVQIRFDPSAISYGELLQIFFSVAHDPTQLNRQGPDSGSQYRSAVFYADDLQRRIASDYIAQLEQAKVFAQPIVTQVDALSGFYPAEDYHQDFYLKNPRYPYIVINDLPKISNLKTLFPDRWRDSPATVAAR